MLDLPLTHPGILEALASAGHGSKILIADGHYPVSTASHPDAARIYLNLKPGVVDANSVLECVAGITPIEDVVVMRADEIEGDPPVWQHYRNTLAASASARPDQREVDLREVDLREVDLREVGRQDFYELARQSDLAVAIATGETQVYANLLLTIGVFALQR